ncbi:hypothetical protein Clacol_007306 [Clathrus columnatus]|uniref:Raptor N-terminal CASPase-like domain-containing protein n=1 Tax=Clathrus columnatus TaxID=1419009 RepID=A0AAV5AH48_9AGAM|nr:hypothetical protein Clacol_007306 [Clathrus columnatus]
MSYYLSKRHLTVGDPTPFPPGLPKYTNWRFPAKIKMSNGILLLCLNLDVDPPDIVKTQPCAVLECWVDPHSLPSNKAIEAIGTNLQHQFETLNPRMKYKPLLDPSVDDARKFCINLRKLAQDERVLFYYNGHGVPKPTPSGELWVFNKSYSQYIPVSLWDLQNWLGSPCVYVWDTSSAGHLLENYVRLAEQRDAEIRAQHGGIFPEGATPFSDCLQLAACMADEQLPMCPDLPADLFTSCLTSPIETAIRWFLLKRANLPISITPDMTMQIPGDLRDRRTPLGELNWIFTAVTDTIAWTSFPRETFKELFRRDLLVAALFRNFLLAERIMKNYHCTPYTHPRLPPTNTHPMWAAWDLAVDSCVAQLPRLLARDRNPSAEPYEYVPSTFFADSLTAFDVWLSRGGCALSAPVPAPNPEYPPVDPLTIPVTCDATHKHALVPRRPPEQLPIVLQVLLAQVHRLRALISFAQFCDLGPWAVNLALTIGIFPYMVKLLMAPPGDVRPVLIFIWARICAVAPDVRTELLGVGAGSPGVNGVSYFASVLAAREEPTFVLIPNAAEHRAMCAFVLTTIARGSLAGQTALANEGVLETCLERLKDSSDYLLRVWVVMCIAQLWAGNDKIKDDAVLLDAPEVLITQLGPELAPDVRAAFVYALSTFLGAIGAPVSNGEDLQFADTPPAVDPQFLHGGGGTGSLPSVLERGHYKLEAGISTSAVLAVREDASPMVRKEAVVLISAIVEAWRGHIIVCAWIYWEEERLSLKQMNHTSSQESPRTLVDTVLDVWQRHLSLDSDETWPETCYQALSGYFTVWAFLLELAGDPFPEVADKAKLVVDWVVERLLGSGFPLAGVDVELHRGQKQTQTQIFPGSIGPQTKKPTHLKRTSSIAHVAHALKTLGNYALDGLSRPASPSRPLTPEWDEERTDTESRISEAIEALEQLIGEDMFRLKARRAGKRLRDRDADQETNGVKLPLRSKFYEWCNEYFMEPQMKQVESHEPGSKIYNMQLWRRSRNERILTETQAQAEFAPQCEWDRPVSTFHASGASPRIALHAYDTHVSVATDRDKLSVWDWAQRKCLRSWSNRNPSSSTITSVRFINDDTDGLVVAGSSDGIVRIWRHENESAQTNIQLLSAFRAIPSLVVLKRGPGLVMDWSQAAGAFLVGGDSKELLVWDATSETKVDSISTQSNSPLTALTADFSSSPLIVAGFADGTIKVFDRRLRDLDSVIRIHREHASWIVGAKCQRHDEKTLVTASVDGQVHLWDSRNAGQSLHTWRIHERMASFDLHEQTGVFVSTSSLTQSNWRSHTTVVHSLRTGEDRANVLSRVIHPTGLHEMPTTHILPYHSNVVFHPNEMLYAVAGADGTIRLVGCKLQDRREQMYAGILRPYDIPPSARSSMDVNGFQHPDPNVIV